MMNRKIILKRNMQVFVVETKKRISKNFFDKFHLFSQIGYGNKLKIQLFYQELRWKAYFKELT
jgi:hypothetical protein